MMRPRRLAPLLEAVPLCLALLAGCEAAQPHPQSALEPAGPAAEQIARLWWVLFWVCTAVFAVVLALAAAAISRRANGRWQPGEAFVVVAGIAFPTVVLVGLLLASLHTGIALGGREAAITIRVIGNQYWWEVVYPEHGIVTANELHIPAGVPVRLELTSRDVIHSFWAPNLGGKRDLIPGLTTELVIEADAPGVFRSQCAEFCGTAHARMALWVVASEPAAFDAWLAKRRPREASAHDPPADSLAALGREVYVAQRCDSCHTIAGEGARIGPTLTHFGSRRSIGAATAPNTTENLARWIQDPQGMKPGNLMPPFDLPPQDLRALVSYLEGLQ